MTPFVIYQGAWNVMERSFEHEIIPMSASLSRCKGDECLNITLGMALAPWNVLAAGKLRTDEEEEKRRQTGEKRLKFWAAWFNMGAKRHLAII